MKIAMMGSGGVGGFFGGRLAKAGCDVTFIARGTHLAAMREQGLTLENEPQGNIHVPQVKAILRGMPVQAFADLDARQSALNALQEALDQLIEQEELQAPEAGGGA